MLIDTGECGRGAGRHRTAHQCRNPGPTVGPSRTSADVRRELGDLLERLTAHYGRAPILYATPEAYERYLAANFVVNDIWIRDIWREPALSDGPRLDLLAIQRPASTGRLLRRGSLHRPERLRWRSRRLGRLLPLIRSVPKPP